MRKCIHLIRHANSDHFSECTDFERMLNARGLADSRLMGAYLVSRQFQPEQIFCSSATRAKTTWQSLNECLGIDAENIHYLDELYLASRSHLVGFIEKLNPDLNDIAIVGHNPGLTEVAYYLTGEDLQNLPTCALYSIQFEVDCWQAIGCESGTSSDYMTARQLKDASN